MTKLDAFILAGGRGKRMGVLCQQRSKPMLPVAGDVCVIDFTLNNCIRSGIEDIAVCTDYQRDGLEDHLRARSRELSEGVMRTESAFRPHRGSADAIYQSIGLLKKSSSEMVLILCGDHVYDMDYRDLARYHYRIGADATIAVIEVPPGDAHRFGVVSCTNNGKVTKFTEKPKVPESQLVSMGVYIFNRQLLIRLLELDARDDRSSHDFGHSVIPGLLGGNLFAFRFEGYWRDIGTPKAYFDTNMEFLKPEKRPDRFDSSTGSIIGNGCQVKGAVYDSILFPGVRVEEGAIVVNSIVMSDSYIGAGSVIDGSILDENVTIGSYCNIGLAGAGHWKNIIVGFSANIASHTFIGANQVVPPGTRAKANDFPVPEFLCVGEYPKEAANANQSVRSS